MTKMLWDKIDDASIAPVAIRREQLQRLANKIRSSKSYCSSANRSYMVAYCMYMHPDRLSSATVQKEFSSAIKHTLKIDPKHTLARLYRGFHLFDIASYNEAHKEFKTVNYEQLARQQQLKVCELMLCIYIYRHGIQKSRTKLRAFISQARHASEYDVFPIQLMHCLALKIPHVKNKEVADQLIEDITEFIREIKQYRIFAKDIETMKGKSPGEDRGVTFELARV